MRWMLFPLRPAWVGRLATDSVISLCFLPPRPRPSPLHPDIDAPPPSTPSLREIGVAVEFEDEDEDDEEGDGDVIVDEDDDDEDNEGAGRGVCPISLKQCASLSEDWVMELLGRPTTSSSPP